MKSVTKILLYLSILLLLSQLFFACDTTSETANETIAENAEINEEGNENKDDTYVTINGLEFIMNDSKDSYRLKKVNENFTGDRVDIPSSIRNLPVTEIGNSGLKVFPNTIKSITIPNTVTSIGNRAFSSCKALESIVIPDSVTELGKAAFENCNSLKSVTIGNSVTSLRYNTFAYCESLESVFIPSTITLIDLGVFDSCIALTDVTIGDGSFNETTVLEIDSSAFNRTSIEKFTIKRNNVKIGNEIFDNFFKDEESLKEVYILGNNIEIGLQAFRAQTKLETVVLGKGVSKIGNNAFSDCKETRLKIYCEAESMPDGWDIREDDANFYWSEEWEYVDGVPTLKQ